MSEDAQFKSFDALSKITDQVIGYRNRLVAGGVSFESADRMAEQFHEVILAIAKEAMRAPSKRR